MTNEMLTGAVIERGEIAEVSEDGYIVRSFTRYAITTLKLKTMNDETYSVGDAVYFFVFPDGNGMILAAIGSLS